MDTQNIIMFIRQRIDGVARNEEQAMQRWNTAQTYEERAAHSTAQQISAAQRLVLQSVLDEIESNQPDISVEHLPVVIALDEDMLYRVINRWGHPQSQEANKEAVAALAFFLLERRGMHPRGVYTTLRNRLVHRTDTDTFQYALYAFLSDLVEQSS